MLLQSSPRRRFAAACMLGTALTLAPAAAQELTPKEKAKAERAAAAESAPAEILFSISDIESVGSNVDDATLTAIFTGDLAGNAEALAGLSAQRITLPELTLETTTTLAGTTRKTLMRFTNLTLADITDGVAASLSLDGISLDAGERGHAEFGKLTASDINIRAALDISGLVDTGQTELETLASQTSFEGGHIVSEDATCDIGGLSVGEVRARPLKLSFAEMADLFEALEAEGDEASPELLGRALHAYADLATAFDIAPARFDGFACSGLDSDGAPMNFAIAGIDTESFTPGHFPTISMDGFDVTVEDDGKVRLGNVTIKSMDYSSALALIATAPAAVDQAWLEEHGDQLLPTFSGFSLADVTVDVPDPDDADTRIRGSMRAFDLTLGAHVNGIPSDVSTSASNIVVELPSASDDDLIAQLRAAGTTTVDLGFALNAKWDSAENTINLNEFSITGADLATIALTATLTNAGESLFSLDPDEALAASMELAISALNLDIADTGLMNIAMTGLAAEQKSDAATLRSVYGGIAQGMAISMLAGAAEAQNTGTALNDFITGKATSLNIDLKAKELPGLNLMDFIAAEDDPTILIGKVDIRAVAD